MTKDALLTFGLDKQPWIKLPFGIWKFFKKCGFTASEMLVVLFFYHKLCHNHMVDSTTVYATSQEIMEYSGVERGVMYNALKKMVSKGLVKAAPHTYELKGFLEGINKRGELYITQGVE